MPISLSPMLRRGLLAMAVSFLPAAQAGDISIFQRYTALNARIDEASRAVDSRNFTEAQRLLAPCLQMVPGHFEAHFLLARMAYEGRDYAGALVHMETAEHSLADLDRRYRSEQAVLKAQSVAEEQALRDSLSELYSRGDPTGGCCGNLVTIKEHALDYLAAKKGHLYDPRNPFAVPADYRFLHGNCLYRLGRRDEALAQYRQAVAQDPAHTHAWNNLVALLLESHDLAGARAELAQAEAAHANLSPALRQAVVEASEPVQEPRRVSPR